MGKVGKPEKRLDSHDRGPRSPALLLFPLELYHPSVFLEPAALAPSPFPTNSLLLKAPSSFGAGVSALREDELGPALGRGLACPIMWRVTGCLLEG